MTSARGRGPRGWRIAGQDPRDRLVQSIANERRMHPEADVPSDAQVAMVLHALADHTALIDAVSFSREGPWPEATSVGRWLHALGDLFDLSHQPRHDVPPDDHGSDHEDAERE